jgi:hypothetical protein
MHVFHASSLEHFTDKSLHHSVVTVTKDDLCDVLNSDPSLWQHLFPSNRLIVNWVPHTATLDDLESIFYLPIDLQCYGTIGDSPESQET